jgi:ArsR family transcriptional regulator
MQKPLGEMETVFKALADGTRLRILGLLLTGEVCVCHIHDALKISQPKASRHLAYLRRARLVVSRRAGTWMHYRLAALPDAVLGTVHRTVTHALRHQPIVRKDLARLEKLTGCCVPKAEETYECCAATTAPTYPPVVDRL